MLSEFLCFSDKLCMCACVAMHWEWSVVPNCQWCGWQ